MKYAIQTANFADPEGTSILMVTEDTGLVLISSVDSPEDWADLMVWAETNQITPHVPPAPPAYQLFKSVFIARLDDETSEPEIMEATLAAAPAKLRLLFNSVEYFVSDDPLFAELRAAVAIALGAQRADQLLAAE